MKIKSALGVFVFFFMCLFGGKVFSQSFTPSDFSNLKLWLRADTGVVLTAGRVSKWNDISGNNLNAEQSVTSQRPADSIGYLINNHHALYFDGNDFLSSLTTPTLDSIPMFGRDATTIFIVASGELETNSTYGLFGAGTVQTGMHMVRRVSATSNNLGVYHNNTSTFGTPVNTLPISGFPFKIIELSKNPFVVMELYINGVLQGSNSTALYTNNMSQNGAYSVGKISNFASAFNGKIAEIIVYTRLLNSSERQQVEQYIYDRYAPPVDLGADINESYSLCPVTLNAGSNFLRYHWSTDDTTSQIQVSESGIYTVTATNVFGVTSTDAIQVTLPDVILNQHDTTLCVGQTVNISSSLSALPGYTYEWQNGDITSTYTASVAGNYYVEVTDVNNCSQFSDTMQVTIDSFGSTVSLGPDVSLCAGNFIQTTSPSTGLGNYGFLWSTGSANSSIPVTSSGTYTVTVTNANSCSGTDDINVTITGTAPTSSFTGANLCLGTDYIPNNTSTGNSSAISNYSWSFGNGAVSSLQNPTYTYTASGSYTVTLEVTNLDGCSASSSQTVVVKENPVSAFNSGLACVNNAYQFTDLSVPPAGETLAQWNWNFGDATSSNSQNPAHSYSAGSTYTITLIVTASNNCSDTSSNSLQVVANAPAPSVPDLFIPQNGWSTTTPNIDFVWNPANNAVNYTLEISTDNFATTAQSYTNLPATAYSYTLASNQTYYWRVIAYNLCNDSHTSPIRIFTVFSPVDFTNLSLWLNADSQSVSINTSNPVPNSVDTLFDRGPFGLNAYQTNLTKQPELVTEALLNHKSVVHFTSGVGGNKEMEGNPIPNLNTSSLTVFAVFNGEPVTTVTGLLGTGTSTTGWMLLRDNNAGVLQVRNNGVDLSTATGPTPATGFPYKLFAYKKELNVSSQTFLNSQTSGAPGVGGSYASSFTMGSKYFLGKAGFGSLYKGSIAELIIYNRLLSSVEQTQVENYLYSKYAPPVNLGPDIFETASVCPVVINADNRFVDYLWSTGETGSFISVQQSGYYSVRTIDVFGRISRDTIHVSFPYLGMSSNDTAVCFGQPLSISANMVNAGAFQYLWNDGAGTITQALSPSVTGNYFSVISDGVCTYNSDTVYVLLDSLELLSLFSDTGVCSGNDLLADGGAYTAGNVLWSTGDTTVSITITAPGVYSVDYTDVYGCNVKDTALVIIKGQAPSADFTVSVSCAGDPVLFVDSSEAVAPDSVTQWSWSFGDGQTATGHTAQNLFANPQQYTIIHTVLTDSGCSGVKTKTITVSPRPMAELTYGGVVCAGTNAQFLDNSDVLLTDTISQWKWVFNNADVFTIENPVYEFPQQGEVPVCLTVTTNNGCVDSMCTSVEVFAPLVANFAAQNFCLGDSVAFNDLTPSLSTVGWQWNFDDGSFFGTTKNTKHKYTAPGNYTVKLRIENAIGCSDTTSKTIQIMTLPVAAFANQNTCEDQFYSPVDSSTSLSEPITNWKWQIASANYSGQSVQHLFADTGSYPVKLKVTTASGCVDSVQQTVIIYPTPVADFDFTPLYGEAPVDVTFNNLSAGAASYVWNFGDGNTSVDFGPTYTYTTNDTFTIQLQSTSGFGCTDGASKTLVVIKTDLDLSVDKVKTIQTVQADGSTLVTVVATISNLGTRTITHFQEYATFGNGTLISEEWNGTLVSGQIMDHVFSAGFVVTAGNVNTFVCVDAKSVNNGQAELRTDNNSNCASLTETLQLFGPSPNPAFSNSTLGIILPKAGAVQIAIADVTGRYAMKEYELSLAEGKNNFELPINELQAAEYFVRVRYNDETQVRKIVVR